jgi:hypothetical protein
MLQEELVVVAETTLAARAEPRIAVRLDGPV